MTILCRNGLLPRSAMILLTFAAGINLAACAQQNPATRASSEAPARTWTSVNGNTVKGAFVREEIGKVYIRRPDGSMIATSRAKLSPNDLLWIDARLNPAKASLSESVAKATQLETTKMEGYKKIRRLNLQTYTNLTSNDRDNKMLAFLLRDALSMYGWQHIGADCYLTKAGKNGKLKSLQFIPQDPVPLREAVQMTKDKFTLPLPDPVIVKEITQDGEAFWDVQGVPSYVSRALLLIDPQTKNIKRFDFAFPPPGKR